MNKLTSTGKNRILKMSKINYFGDIVNNLIYRCVLLSIHMFLRINPLKLEIKEMLNLKFLFLLENILLGLYYGFSTRCTR